MLKSGISNISEGYLTCNGVVGRRFNCCNFLFRSLSALYICKVQYVQNSLASTNPCQYHQVLTHHFCWKDSPLVEHCSIFKTTLLVYKVVILNILNLFLNLDIMCKIHIGVRLMAWYFRSHTLPHPYISRLLNTLVSAFDASKIWNDLTDDIQQLLSPCLE